MSGEVAWQSTNPQIIDLIESNAPVVQMTITKAGSVQVTATYDGFSETIDLLIEEAELSSAILNSLNISQTNPLQLSIENSLQLTAIAGFDDSSSKDVSLFSQWNSTDSNIVSVNSTVLITALSLGQTEIGASYTENGLTYQASIVVEVLASVEVPIFTLSLENATSDSEGPFEANTQIQVTASQIEGKVFNVWEGSGVAFLQGILARTTSILMPSENIALMATYSDYSPNEYQAGIDYYQAQCSDCHGADGADSSGKGLIVLQGNYTLESLAQKIADTMPKKGPGRSPADCVDDWANQTAKIIWAEIFQ